MNQNDLFRECVNSSVNSDELKILYKQFLEEKEAISDEKLLDGMWELKNSIMNFDDSVITYQRAKLMFAVSKELIFTRKSTDAFKYLFGFSRDDLFTLFVTKKNCYYRVAYAFYEIILGKNPGLGLEKYEDVQSIVQGKTDNGYMNIDYFAKDLFLTKALIKELFPTLDLPTKTISLIFFSGFWR